MLEDIELKITGEQLVRVMAEVHHMAWHMRGVELDRVTEHGVELERVLAEVTPHMRSIMTAYGQVMTGKAPPSQRIPSSTKPIKYADAMQMVQTLAVVMHSLKVSFVGLAVVDERVLGVDHVDCADLRAEDDAVAKRVCTAMHAAAAEAIAELRESVKTINVDMNFPGTRKSH